jgi:3'-5' exoribonuclease
MKERFVADLKAGTIVNTTFLVQSRELKKARTGSSYLEVRLQDATGMVLGRHWDADGLEFDFDVNDLVMVKADIEEYQGVPQLRLGSIVKHVGPADLRDYLPRSPNDSEAVYSGLLERLRRMPEGPIRRLLLGVMEDAEIARQYKLAPAAVLYHHAYLGGLLDHVRSLVRLGDSVADRYPWLNRDLVLAGLVLHDLGKIEELQYDGAFRYSTRGQLLGHIIVGLEIVRRKIGGISGFPETLANQIEHIILSHHGKLEFGSPKEPMFAEALVVHYLDDLDSKLESVRAQYQADRSRPGEWTVRNRALGRELLKTELLQPIPKLEPDGGKAPAAAPPARDRLF